MEIYNIIYTTNEKVSKGEVITQQDKVGIINKLSSSVTPKEKADGFMANREKVMYPYFYIPPYNKGKKLRLITGELPKTHILSANHYELEILRILALWDSNNVKVKTMLEETANRLDKTCFGNFCSAGECPAATISVIRFWSAYKPEDTYKINALVKRFTEYHDHKGTWKNGLDIPNFYMWLTLSEINTPNALNEIDYGKDQLLSLLRRGWIVNENNADRYNLLRKYIVRNTLARLPEFEYLKKASIYIGNDGRCYCDTELELI